MMQSSGVVNTLLIAVSGCSCSGKSTVVKELASFNAHSLMVHQDDYYKPAAPQTADGMENWDAIEALDTVKLLQDVKALIQDPSKSCPACLSANDNEENNQHIVYIEGTMVLDIGKLSELLHTKIFITLSYDECLRRRRQRWKDYIDPPGFFDGCVWPMYMKRETTLLKDLTVKVIDGHQTKEEIVKTFLDVNK
ncbi:nicotinamide riboside kinase 2-like [Dysidea avara]|uniref:nicotinamide riboside kinase 2-like n=1 Tax=Dysidea avara TaxID=196820 RepID=UPI00332F0603